MGRNRELSLYAQADSGREACKKITTTTGAINRGPFGSTSYIKTKKGTSRGYRQRLLLEATSRRPSSYMSNKESRLGLRVIPHIPL